MQIAAHDNTRLVIHQGPWALRLMGALFAIIGAGVLWLITHGHIHDHNAWVAVVVGLAFAIAGCAMALGANDLLFVFDKGTRMVTIRRRGLFAARTEQYRWSDIQDVALERSIMPASRGQQSTPCYRPVFMMREGGRVPWMSISTSDLKPQATCVAAVRAFTGWHVLSDADQARDTSAARKAASSTRAVRYLFAPFLAIFILLGGYLYAQQWQRYLSWIPTRAVIVSSSVTAVSSSKGGYTYRPDIGYRYNSPQGPIIAFGSTILQMSSSYAWASRVVDRYRPGATVTAYIDPVHPSAGFLERHVSSVPLIFVFGPLAVMMLVLFANGRAQQGIDLVGAAHVPIIPASMSPIGPRAAATPSLPSPFGDAAAPVSQGR